MDPISPSVTPASISVRVPDSTIDATADIAAPGVSFAALLGTPDTSTLAASPVPASPAPEASLEMAPPFEESEDIALLPQPDSHGAGSALVDGQPAIVRQTPEPPPHLPAITARNVPPKAPGEAAVLPSAPNSAPVATVQPSAAPELPPSPLATTENDRHVGPHVDDDETPPSPEPVAGTISAPAPLPVPQPPVPLEAVPPSRSAVARETSVPPSRPLVTGALAVEAVPDPAEAVPSAVDGAAPLAPFTVPAPSAGRVSTDAAIPVISARPSHIGRELGVEIARHIGRDDRDTMLVRLDPAHHGQIEVTMTFDDTGQLRAVVTASNPATLDMLRRDSADLTRALGDAGVNADAGSFQFDSRANHGGDPKFPERQGRSVRFPDPDPIAPTGPAYRPLLDGGRVNLVA